MLTEGDYCPQTGDGPNPSHRYWRPRNPNPLFTVVGRILPGDLTDEQAEHERAMYGAYSWSRGTFEGRPAVALWVEM